MATPDLKRKRNELGLCIYCAGMRDDAKYKMCASCKEKQRERNARWRNSVALLRGKCLPPVQIIVDRSIPKDHKCWNCEWSRFEGDRFFCPFVEGTCVKEKKQENE